MNRSEAVEAVERLADALESDLETCQTRGQHLLVAGRVAEARAIAEALRAPAP